MLCLRDRSDARAPFVLPEYLKMALSTNIMRNVARFKIRGHGLKCVTGYTAGVRTGVHVFAFCVITGIIFIMYGCTNGVLTVNVILPLYHHVWAPDIYGTSSTIYLIIFLKVISKVLFFNITQRFTNSLVQLWIFLTGYLLGPIG